MSQMNLVHDSASGRNFAAGRLKEIKKLFLAI
jgi:hypothetical protein